MKYKRPWIANYQRKFIDDPARLVLVDAATKTGKTVSLIVWLFEQALKANYGDVLWWVAPSKDQAKIAFSRLSKKFLRHHQHMIEVNETFRTVTITPIGATIAFKTGEKPDLLYGEDVVACVIDEGTRMREEAWTAIQTTLTATGGPVRIISNVKGKDNWVFRLGERIKSGDLPNSAYYIFTYEDACRAGIGSWEALEFARSTMHLDWFRELYYCIPRIGGEKPWAYGFKREKHLVTGLKYNPIHPVFVSFDFNVDPIVCILEQHGTVDNKPFIHYFKEFRIENSSTQELCNRVRAYFDGRVVRFQVTGDASGKQRSTAGAGRSNWDEVIRWLRVRKSQCKGVWGSNPGVSDTRTVVNGILQNHPELLIDAEQCPYLVEDLEQVQAKPDDSVDKTGDNRLTHLLDAFRYDIWHFHRDWFRKYKPGN